MSAPGGSPDFSTGARVGWEAALLDIEHQAEHWDTPEHGAVGHLLAEALRAAVEITRTGGLQCEHRGGSADIPRVVLQVAERTPGLAPFEARDAEEPPSVA